MKLFVVFTFLLALCLEAQSKGGGGFSSGGRGSSSAGRGSSSSGGRSSPSAPSKPFASAPKGSAGRSLPRTPTWAGRKPSFSTNRNVGRNLIFFWLGWNLISHDVNLSNIYANCSACKAIRDGFQTCTDAKTNMTGDARLDQECFCPQVNYDLYDDCFRCEPRLSDQKAAIDEIRDTCDSFLQEYISPASTSTPNVALGFLVVTGIVVWSIL